jgi:hypothetical protein
MFQRVAAPEFGAFALGELRLALGAAVLLPFFWRERAQVPLRLWPMLLLIGAINSAIPSRCSPGPRSTRRPASSPSATAWR